MGTTLENAKAFMELQFGTPITLCFNSAGVFAQYQNEHCFNASVQSCYTEKGLHAFYAKADRRTIYELSEPLGTFTLRFFICDTLVMVGPYVETEWDEANADRLLSSLNLPSSILQAYKLYKCRYSVLNTHELMRAVAAMIELEGEPFESYAYHRLAEKGQAESEQVTIPDKYDYRRIEEEYALEKAFMFALANGEEARTLALLSEMGRRFPQGQLTIAKGGSYRLVATTILRTIVRLAAQQSCLTPIVVDAIVESYAQRLAKLGRLPSEEESNRLTVDMIRELCSEIHRQQMVGYSPLVCKAMQYVRMHLGHNLSLPILGRELGVSPAHLSKVFRTETGEGISLYIRRQRCSKAARLLCTTRHTVQDVGGLVGYTDANYFIKVFKQEFGETPARYRNQNQ